MLGPSNQFTAVYLSTELLEVKCSGLMHARKVIFVAAAAAASAAADTSSNEKDVQQTGERLLSILKEKIFVTDGVNIAASLENALSSIENTTSGKKTPQERALLWLSDTLHNNRANSEAAKVPNNADVILVQKYALAVLYFTTNGDEWRECSRLESGPCETDGPQSSARFLSDGSVCTWYGITCSDEKKKGVVTWIDLSQQNLDGTIPDELSILKANIELLWLSGNKKLSGTLPHWIGSGKNLNSLSLFDTGLGGTLPESLYDLSKMWSLRLYGSEFEGTISHKIGRLSYLQWLWLHDNNFNGSLPKELGSLKKLEAITLHGNSFDTKDVPSELCSLRKDGKKLEHLWTDCNDEGSCLCCTRCWPGKDFKVKAK